MSLDIFIKQIYNGYFKNLFLGHKRLFLVWSQTFRSQKGGHNRPGLKRPGHKRPGHKRLGHKRPATVSLCLSLSLSFSLSLSLKNKKN